MTTKLSDPQNYLDINGLNDIRRRAKSGDKTSKDEALVQAAKQFEAIFMQMLLKSMRKAQEVLESDSPFNSQSSKFYRDMHDQQMSLELSNNGSLGLSELIVRQLGGDSENFKSHHVVRFDGNILSKENTPSKENTLSKNQAMPLSATQSVLLTKVSTPLSPSKDHTEQINDSKGLSQLLQTPSFEQPIDFVKALTADAKRVQEKLHVPFEVVIAQAALETGWGQKIIKTQQGDSSNNLFNIKADKRWLGEKTHKETLEFEQGAMVKKREPFRVYDSIAGSVNDYVDLLSNSKRYQEALKHASNVEQFLHKLQSAGYATDPDYAKKIMATLKTVMDLMK